MTRKQREQKRAIANGEVYIPTRLPAIPANKVMRMKTDYKRNKRVTLSDYM